MSGVEVAGLAFGILSILIEVVKSYSYISKKVHTLRHYSKEVQSISARVKVQNGIFLNEVRLLLQFVEDENDVETMLEDASDQRWTSEQLNDSLREVLRGSFEICGSIVQETKDIIEQMKEEMTKFDTLLDQKSKGETIKSLIRRLGASARIAFDKSRHDKCLTELRVRNGELSALRSQISAFQQRENRITNSCIQHQKLPTKLCAIQDASRKLHEALCEAWCCDDARHRGHYAKLCVDADAQVEVRLDLAISCHKSGPHVNNYPPRNPPIWLYVQSTSTSGRGLNQQSTTPSQLLPCATLPSELIKSCGVKVVKKKASTDLQPQSSRQKKAKRVHFANPSVKPTLSPTAPAVPALPYTVEFNLSQAKNICEYLQRRHQAHMTATAQRCIGYLETPRMYKHSFFFRDDDVAPNARRTQTQVANAYSLFDAMRCDVDDVLAVEDQLKLAHKTALAILQFSETPWLSERWRLRDVSYFGSSNSLDQQALKTLHLSSQISSAGATVADRSNMDGVQSAGDAVSDEVRYGINNTTLFFLGVALLEIAHWKPIEQKMTARDLDNEVFAARRLASGRAPLGPDYQKIAEKCLQCNFGFGTKLSNKGLRTAVYNDVVCELESMIAKLEI